MGEFQKSLTAYKLFGVTGTMGIILNKQCVSLHRWYHRPGGTRLKKYDCKKKCKKNCLQEGGFGEKMVAEANKF